jgi:hypothetical protein
VVHTRPLGIRADAPCTESQLRRLRVIADFDLTRVRARLLKEGELDAEAVDPAILEFRRYLGLSVVDPRPLSMFSEDVDEVWHACVLFTRLYADLCDQALGYFLHHEPNDGMEPSDGSEDDPHSDWSAFAEVYTALYGPPGPIWSSPVTQEDIDGLEARLNALADTLAPGERGALARMLALAMLGESAEDEDGPRTAGAG